MSVRYRCTWGQFNTYVDCGFTREQEPGRLDGKPFCDVHSGAVEHEGWPVWLAQEVGS